MGNVICLLIGMFIGIAITIVVGISIIKDNVDDMDEYERYEK